MKILFGGNTMDRDILKKDIFEVLKKHKINNVANYDLAFKEFMRYFGENVIDPKEEAIIEKIKNHTDIKAIPKEVINMQDLIPNIRATIQGKLKQLGWCEYTESYEQVIQDLESFVLSTMVNDIVKSKNHKALYYDYRTAVKLKTFTIPMFQDKGTFERIVEKDNTGQIKKTIKNLISATDGKTVLSSPTEFVENINKFIKTFNVDFLEKSITEVVNEEGTKIKTERFSKPYVKNNSPLLLIRKVTEYILNTDEYQPTKQYFELILVAYNKK